MHAQPAAPGFKVPPAFVVTEYADHTLANDIHCMTVDAKGRIVVAGRGYIRILVDDDGDGRADRAIEFAAEPKDGAMGLLWEGHSLLVMGDGGLRRFVDADGDGKADGPSQLLRAMKTGGEHAAHALSRGPDGWLYVLCGNNTGIDKSYATLPSSPIKEPIAGCVLRFTPDFKHSEIVAHGFRNAYGMDFNQEGELFTFDSDNERCVSLPWYEPTRFYHVQSGGFYGWLAPQRAGFWRLPPYFIDVVPPLATLGRGSPTGVAFYRHAPPPAPPSQGGENMPSPSQGGEKTRSPSQAGENAPSPSQGGGKTQFPSEYHGGMFLCDWTFGKVYFTSLKRTGATYEAKAKLFLEATGDNGFAPTAVLVHPRTGDLFIAIGGRGTRGAVYRVRYEKGRSSTMPSAQPALAARSLAWTPAVQETATKLVDSPHSDDRLRALQTMNRFPEKFTELVRWQAFLANGASKDWSLHLACVSLLRKLLPTLDAKSKLAWETKVNAPRSVLTLAHAHATFDPARALVVLETIVEKQQPGDIRLDVLRVLQIALGDIGSPKQRGTLWEGYTLRGPRPAQSVAERAQKIALAALQRKGAEHNSDFAIRQEFLRTAALLEMDHGNYGTAQRAGLTGITDSPQQRIHDYACVARMPGQRTPEETEKTASVLLGLDELAVNGKWNRDLNWPLRVKELYQGLADKDTHLHAAMLRHADFGRPDHVLFTEAKGFDRKQAATVFLDRIAKDQDYALNPAIVVLLGELPAKDILAVVRPRWGSTGVESALLPLLAKEPEAADRTKFIDGLAATQPEILSACLAGLAKLPGQDDGSEALALIRALGNLSAKQQALSAAIVRRLTHITGQMNGTDKHAWTVWFSKTYPNKAARLANPDGVDVEAWNKRLTRLDWQKGDHVEGKKIFTKASCVNCHSGSQAVGPDLAGAAGRFSRADLFTAILQPSRDVPARYQMTVVETTAGKIYQGVVIYDAVDSLILQTGPATTVRLDPGTIAARRVSPLSPMPPGLLDRLVDQEVVDLYAYLKGLGMKK